MYFKLSGSFIDDYKGKQPDWGYGALSYVTYKRSYARPLDPEDPKGPTEEYWQTCQRVVEGTFELQKRHIRLMGARWDYVKAQKTAQQMFKFMWEFKFLPPGRGLWAMGTPLVMDRGNTSPLFNCGYVSTTLLDTDFAEPFCFLFEASAHGVGVGFDTKGVGKVVIVEPKQGKDTFVVEDSREGWSALLRRVLDAYVGKGSIPAHIDYSLVRPAGAPIKSFGGTASGPEALQELIEIDIPKILEQTGKVTSTQIVDIMNVIGKCVVAGGARRSSEIALGDIEDKEFRDLKLDMGKVEAYRWNSNNSLIVPPFHGNFEEFVDPIMSRGEPGFFFIENAQNYSRMSDPPDYSDKRVKGLNPCLRGDMRLLTETGYRPISELAKEGNIKIISELGRVIESTVWSSGIKPVVALKFIKKAPIVCTRDHKFMTINGDTVEAQDLKGKRLMPYYQIRNDFTADNTAFLAGLIQGDGTTTRTGRKLQYSLRLGKNDQDICELYRVEEGTWYDEKVTKAGEKYNLVEKQLPERTFPDYAFSEQELLDFLSGVYTANGSVISPAQNGRVSLKGTCFSFISSVKDKLELLGIDSYITTNKAKKVTFSNGDYTCKQSYDLNINSLESLVKFASLISFGQEYKRKKLEEAIRNNSPMVVAVTPWGEEEVFDFSQPETHWGVVEGMITHNCGEQTLEDHELCNIPETFPARCDSKDEFMQVLKIAYLYGKTVTLGTTPWPKSNEVMLRNRRVGVSMTGITQNISKVGFAEHIRWCREGYAYIQELDLKYSEWLCIRESIKTTTTKPSGTVSLLAGATPGIHYPHAEYYIRRVRFNKSSPLLAVLEKANYPIEQDVYDKQSMVVSFPIHEKNFFRGKKDVTIWEQLENAAQMQAHWSDNSVSITVDVKPHEAKDIPAALDRYQFRLKAVSFLPTDAGDYKQPPYEEITREEYERVVERLKELDLSSSVHEITDKFCDGDLCQLT